jgi:hypothetical protein
MNENKIMPLRHRTIVALLLAGILSAVAPGQRKASPEQKAGVQAPDVGRGGAELPAQPAPSVDPGQALYLVCSTLLTLNDANRSGNYTVLRDLAAPDFQSRNSAADLALSFADLRRRNFNLFGAALLAPQFSSEPFVDGSGKMHLTGTFPTRPLQIGFDLVFQSINGQWRLFAISVATPQAPVQESRLVRPPMRRSPELLHGFRLFSGNVGLRW